MQDRKRSSWKVHYSHSRFGNIEGKEEISHAKGYEDGNLKGIGQGKRFRQGKRLGKLRCATKNYTTIIDVKSSESEERFPGVNKDKFPKRVLGNGNSNGNLNGKVFDCRKSFQSCDVQQNILCHVTSKKKVLILDERHTS
jgi:hypothetical protein